MLDTTHMSLALTLHSLWGVRSLGQQITVVASPFSPGGIVEGREAAQEKSACVKEMIAGLKGKELGTQKTKNFRC